MIDVVGKNKKQRSATQICIYIFGFSLIFAYMVTTYSHSQFVTYGGSVKAPQRHSLTHWVALYAFFNLAIDKS